MTLSNERNTFPAKYQTLSSCRVLLRLRSRHHRLLFK